MEDVAQEDLRRERDARELCIGKGFLFSDRGTQALRGFEDPVQIWEVRWRED